MNSLKIYCVTNKPLKNLENSELLLAGVGQHEFTKNYIIPNNQKNIFYKEKYYSELTFHYWYWKNLLAKESSQWVGFCQKRRFWIKEQSVGLNINSSNLKDHLLINVEKDWNVINSIICNPINVSGAKKIKLIKKGWRHIIKNPKILLGNSNETIKIHFDMHHGHGNLDKAINLLNKTDREDFKKYVNKYSLFNPHIMLIAKPEILDLWFNSLFKWLEDCEEVFGFEKLEGYETTRIYAYLAERYLSFWFKKYTKYKEHPWVFIDN